jgi:MFS family permease
MYGRKPVYMVFMAIYTLFIIPAAITNNITTLLVSRFLGAFAGSVMVSNGAGSISDLVREERRGLAFSIFAIGPMNAPVFGPLIGGFVFENLGWRWNNCEFPLALVRSMFVLTNIGVALILAGACFVAISLVPETYSPHILRKRTQKIIEETKDDRWWCRYDERKPMFELFKVNLSRPFIMAATEPICIFWNLYISVVYATLYLCFVAYPIIFGHFRQWTPGKVGLSYLGIGSGSLLASALEPIFRKLIQAHTPDRTTGKPTPEAMVSVMCVGALAIPLGEFIFAFTSLPPVHWIVPILAGIPFGMGNTIAFAYSNAYLANTYGVYAASALAGQSVLRSMAGGVLPLAGPAMYDKLGPKWAGLTLAIVELALVPIPFVFWRNGERIRRKSRMIAQLRMDQERLDQKGAVPADNQVPVNNQKKRELEA